MGSFKEVTMTVKLTIQHVKFEFEKAGWVLHTDNYEHSQQKLDVTCPNGHVTTITWNNFQRGQGCGFCSGRFKYNLTAVRRLFTDIGYEPLFDNYINNSTPLPFKCTRGHEATIRLLDFLQGVRCGQCRGFRLSESLRASREDLEKLCIKAGAKLIKHWLEGGRTYLSYECKNGHTSKALLTNFRRHLSCWECSKLKKSGENCYRWNPDREYIKKIRRLRKVCERIIRRCLRATRKNKTNNTANLLGYTPEQLKNHIDNHPNMVNCIGKCWHVDHIFPIKAFLDYGIEDLSIINCLENLRPLENLPNLVKGGNYDAYDFEIWLNKKGIPFNVAKRESQINEINNWVRSLGVTSFIEDGRINIGKVRIKYVDAFTFDTNQKVNFSEFKDATKNGIRLITIFFDEWQNKNSQCKNFIKSILGLNSRKIYARNCEVKEVPPTLAREFFNNHHIQGSNRLGAIFYGLYLDSEIVGIMSLGRHNRQNGASNSILLDRLCFKEDCQVVGGASKLLNYCVEWAKTNNYSSIISFSDNRWSDGHIYEVLKFSLTKEYRQDYSYINLNGLPRRLSKQSQKKKLVNCPEGMTEFEWAKRRGLSRIYDCGKKRWTLFLTMETQNEAI